MADLPEEGRYEFQDDASGPAEGPPGRSPEPGRRKPKGSAAREEFLANAAKATRMPLRDKLILTGFLAVLVGFAAFMAVRQQMQQSAEQEALQAAIHQFLFLPVRDRPGSRRARAGKVVLIDARKQALDRLHRALPEELRATTPAEVETIARMDYDRKVVGRFETGAEAVELNGTMTLIDRATRTFIAARSFSWGKPPTSIPRSSDTDDVTGPPPLKEMAAFLTEYR